MSEVTCAQFRQTRGCTTGFFVLPLFLCVPRWLFSGAPTQPGSPWRVRLTRWYFEILAFRGESSLRTDRHPLLLIGGPISPLQHEHGTALIPSHHLLWARLVVSLWSLCVPRRALSSPVFVAFSLRSWTEFLTSVYQELLAQLRLKKGSE